MLEDAFTHLSVAYVTVLLGELNYDPLSHQKPETLYVQLYILCRGFTQIIDKRTRITDTSKTLLDVIIVNDLDCVHSHVVNDFLGKSDHYDCNVY